MHSEDKLRHTISQLPDEQLVRILTVEFADYRKEALEFAEAEIKARGIPLSKLPGVVSILSTQNDANDLGLKSIRITAGILFLLGCFWAALAWVLVIAPFGLSSNFGRDLALCVNSLAGYFVWFGWGWFAFKGKLPCVDWKTFWLISLLQHLAWLALLPSVGPPPLFWNTWIFGNILIALYCILRPMPVD